MKNRFENAIIVELAAYNVMCTFNECARVLSQILQEMRVQIGPNAYVQSNILVTTLFFYEFRKAQILRDWEFASTSSASDCCQKTHIGCTKSETCLSRETFNKCVLISIYI